MPNLAHRNWVKLALILSIVTEILYFILKTPWKIPKNIVKPWPYILNGIAPI